MTTKIGVMTGTTRTMRVNFDVANYVLDFAKNLDIDDVEFELVDIKDYNLPLFDGVSPMTLNGVYPEENVQAWADKITSLDGFIFILPEYNGSMPSSLKNAFDYLGREWGNKAAGIVSYGMTLGIRSQLSLRQVLASFNVATVGPAGALSIFTDFAKDEASISGKEFTPQAHHTKTLTRVVETTVAWSTALKTVRA